MVKKDKSELKIEAIENGTFYRLLCRMEEIKEEMISS